MALTLNERANMIAGRATSETASLLEKIGAAIAKLGGDVMLDQLDNTHAVFAGAKAVTMDQLKEWAWRALQMHIQPKMGHLIMDDPALTVASNDTDIINAARRYIWGLAKEINTASLSAR